MLADAAEEAERADRSTVLIGGICGATRQATAEAELLQRLGYHAGLVSLAALGVAAGSVVTQTLLRDLFQGRELIRVFSLMGMVLAASHADEKANPGIYVMNPWPGATPGMRVR